MNNDRKKGLLVVISGPSGVGKGTVCRRVLQADPRIIKSVSATTRPPRPGEKHGKNYFFVTPEKFSEMRERGEFLESFTIFGNSYGTPRAFAEGRLGEGFDVLLEIDVQGGLAVRSAFPDAVLIFLMPPSLSQLESRLRGRGTETEEVIRRRLAAAEEELSKAQEYDYTVVNAVSDAAAEEILKILRSEKSRKAQA